MCWKRKQVKINTQVEEVVKLDPRGMVRNDIEFIRSNLPELGYQKGDSLTDIAYKQGQWDLLKFIENKVVGRRISNGPLAPKTRQKT